MAVLGAQLVITLIIVSVIQKLSPHYSIARWLLCSTGLVRYMCPTNSQLRLLAQIPRKNKKIRNRVRDNGKIAPLETFYVSKNLHIELESTEVVAEEIVQLRYYEEYKWLIDFSLYAALVYILTEVVSTFSSIQGEINLSMLWCLIVVGFSVKIITTLTGEYFNGESFGERSTVIVSAFFFLFLVMVILIIDEATLETGLDTAYYNFSTRANNFLKTSGSNSQGPASKLVLKFFLAVWCSYIGCVLVFPSLRLARMHYDTLTYCAEKKLLLVALNLNFVSPLIICLFWIRPIFHDYFTSRVFWGMPKPLFSVKSFESLRIILIIVCMLSRLVIMPVYMQSYLNMAYHRIVALKTEVGKISNIELQRRVASVFYYICVVALQYLIPLVMCLFLAFMYKTLGEYEWNDVFRDSVFSPNHFNSPIQNTSMCEVFDNSSVSNISIIQNGTNGFYINSDFSDFVETENFGTFTSQTEDKPGPFQLNTLNQIFTKEIFRGVIGFSLWWMCFAWFLTSNFGLLYYMYFST